MMTTVVFGYGNDLCGDDGLGPWAARSLGEVAGDLDLEIIECFQLMPEHAAQLARADRALFLDANASLAPGEIARQDFSSDRVAGSVRIAHDISPETLLWLARSLYGSAPQKATLFSVGAGCLEPGAKFSSPVKAAVPELLRQATAWLQE